MRTLLTTLNSKYIHHALSLKCLKNFAKGYDVLVREYTINDNTDAVISHIHKVRADIIAFSCYIWNVEKTLIICDALKKINPDLIIILGGLEVSFDAPDIMKKHPYIDYIIQGEGEVPFKKLLSYLEGDISDICQVESLWYRFDDEILFTKTAPFYDINQYEFVYDDTIAELKGKIIYYESSRGCPYNCSYCLSGRDNKVTFLDVDRVKKELKFFMDKGVSLVKFVDRTFNADRRRADEIFKFISDNPSDTRFHFELAGDLIDDKTLNILKDMPKDAVQFEIGVQTTNPRTIEAIGRKIDFLSLKKRIIPILEWGNIHIHLDLIAGLPYEDIDSFKNSFNDVISLKPHMLQLGFLKLLKGSRIRNEKDKYGYVFKSHAPYEVISNDFMSYDDISYLKDIEHILDLYYNSGGFKHTFEHLFSLTDDYFGIFDRIHRYFETNYLYDVSHSVDSLFDIISEIFKSDKTAMENIVKDRFINKNAKIKPRLHTDDEFLQKCYDFFKDDSMMQKYYPEFFNVPAKKIFKFLTIEQIGDKAYIFRPKTGECIDITEDFMI
ncbi:MAG: DUF4080 domain-containing protein [Ruminococcaceae bacterium]|nr:DUF4080 domain-containing protein [Oscillospiraceae bacterium]